MNMNEFSFSTIEVIINKPVSYIYLNRPDSHNSLNNIMIEELTYAFEKLRIDEDTRLIILTGRGKSFCSGADLNWMKNVINQDFSQNYAESVKLARLMRLIFVHPKPVIALANGSAIGGGAGLMCACDIVIANDTAKFGFSEVKLGLAPAVISPYVVLRIGHAAAKELFITGERVDALHANRIGLVNYAVAESELDSKVNNTIEQILSSGPDAIKNVKTLLAGIEQLNYTELEEYTAKIISDLRISKEGQEGMNAFLNKTSPGWINRK